MEQPIGVIDSGVGGLTVVKEMLKRLPNESIVYIGDEKRCPYGPRTPEEVRQYTIEMAAALSAMDIKMLVIACNTATAVALDDVRAQFDFPVIGVIGPGARGAVKATKLGKIAVLGTEGTIKSRAYEQEIERQFPGTTVYPLACPEFVPLVESGQYRSAIASEVVERSLRELDGKEFDAAILGCTHYPLLKHPIRQHLPENVQIISSAIETVVDVEKGLRENNLFRDATATPVEPIFYTTGPLEKFRTIICDWLAMEDADVRQIRL